MLTVIFIVIFSFAYAEWIWSLVKTSQKSFREASIILKSVVGMNYMLAVFFSAWGCLICAAIVSLYQMVVFKERVKNLSGPVA